jgi:hypothetical protein
MQKSTRNQSARLLAAFYRGRVPQRRRMMALNDKIHPLVLLGMIVVCFQQQQNRQ